MKKGFVFCFCFVSLIVLASCSPKSDTAAETESAPPEIVKPEKVVATVTDDSLRVREMPYLDAGISGYLMAGDQIVVETRTQWTEVIGEFNTFWFFIRADGYSGWTYGGYLNFGDIRPASIPSDPVIRRPVPEQRDSQPDITTGYIDPSTLPEILLPVFGMEEDIGISDTTEGVITYDPFHEYLVLPFTESSESRLGTFVDENRQAPFRAKDSLRVIAESPGSSSYEREYGAGEYRLLSDSLQSIPDTGNGSSDAVLIPFYRLATLDSGSWEFYAFIGDDNWPVAVGKVNIAPGEISIVPVSKPDPLRDSPRSVYTKNDIAYAFGNRKEGPGRLQVALYNDSDEYSGGKILLRPVSAVLVTTDTKGRWSAEFKLDGQVPEGRCWPALGNPIEGLKNLRLFITSIEI